MTGKECLSSFPCHYTSGVSDPPSTPRRHDSGRQFRPPGRDSALTLPSPKGRGEASGARHASGPRHTILVIPGIAVGYMPLASGLTGGSASKL